MDQANSSLGRGMGYSWGIHGVFMGYSYVSVMYRLCVGYVSVMYRLPIGTDTEEGGFLFIFRAKKNKIPTTLTTTNQQHYARQHRERQETQTHHRNFMASACWRAQLLLKEKMLFKLLIIYSLYRLSCTKFE